MKPAAAMRRPPVAAYQFSLRTSRTPDQVLDDLDQRRLPGIGVAERGTQYMVLRPERRYRYGGDIAAGLSVALVLLGLILTAVSPVILIVFLVAALVPPVPLLFDRHRPDLAVSAVVDDDGATRVTVHGQATSELAAALDAYLGALPQAEETPVAR